MTKYQIVSLGDHCLIAAYLKEQGFRSASYPFDWVQTNVDVVRHVLADNFATFCTADSAAFYGKMINNGGKLHVHRDIALEETQMYLQRCVERFKALRDNGAQNTFMMSITQSSRLQTREPTATDFQAVYDLLVGDYGIKVHKLVVLYLTWAPPPVSTNPAIVMVHWPHADTRGAYLHYDYQARIKELFSEFAT